MKDYHENQDSGDYSGVKDRTSLVLLGEEITLESSVLYFGIKDQKRELDGSRLIKPTIQDTPFKIKRKTSEENQECFRILNS